MAQLFIEKNGKITHFSLNSPYDIKKSDFNVIYNQGLYYITNNFSMDMGTDTRVICREGTVEYIIKDSKRCVFGFSNRCNSKISSSFVFYPRFESNEIPSQASGRKNKKTEAGTLGAGTSEAGTLGTVKENRLNKKKKFNLEQLFPHRN